MSGGRGGGGGGGCSSRPPPNTFTVDIAAGNNTSMSVPRPAAPPLPSRGGGDGGTIGDTGGDDNNRRPNYALSFAKHAAQEGILVRSPSRALVVIDGRRDADANSASASAAGSGGFEFDYDYDYDEPSVRDALSSGGVEIAWLASPSSSTAQSQSTSSSTASEEEEEEEEFLARMERTFPNSFHVHRQSSSSASAAASSAEDGKEETSSTCRLYAIPDVVVARDDEDDDGGGFSDFIGNVARGMPWAPPRRVGGEEEAGDGGGGGVVARGSDGDGDGDNARLSFASIFLILLGTYVLSWTVYFMIKLCHERRRAAGNGDNADNNAASSSSPPVPSPHDMWFLALTRYPVLFLLFSVLIPVVLSYVAYVRDGRTVRVNLDFDGYLDIDTMEERMHDRYRALLDYQTETLKEERANCNLLEGGREAFFDLPPSKKVTQHAKRELQSYGRLRGSRAEISFFYQNRLGGNVFAPETIASIREFEMRIMSSSAFEYFCRRDEEGEEEEEEEEKPCFSFDSLVPYFYADRNEEEGFGEDDENGKKPLLVEDDIQGVLRIFSGSTSALSKMDKYFSRTNLASNVTFTNVHIDRGRVDGDRKEEFIEMLHGELWEIDQGGEYPDIIISWSNGLMQELEAENALEHDLRWSLAALCFIGIMVFVKVRSAFQVLAGVSGLVLSFTSALYWQVHFDFDELTVMHVAGIFVMLGIGADDIFLTVDSFEHTKVLYSNHIDDDVEREENEREGEGERAQDTREGESKRAVRGVDDPEIIRRRMISSYRMAGSMLLVSSVTTAICFFSNALSAVIAIRDFGTFMGMVVILNYIHVMTILPSAILVTELHIKPFQRRVWRAICSRKRTNDEGTRVPHSTNGVLDADTGIMLSPDVVGEVEDGVSESGGDEIGEPPPAMSRRKVIGEENDRRISTPDTIPYPSDDDELSQQRDHTIRRTPDDYHFLDRVEEMTTLDRYFVRSHAPFVYKWRKMIVLVSLIAAIVLGVFAWLNFSIYDGTIIVFKEKYNLGRVQRIVDKYYPDFAVDKFLEAEVDDEEFVDVPAGSGFDIGGGNSFGIEGIGASVGNPASNTPAPIPASVGPSSHPSSSPSSVPSEIDSGTSLVSPSSAPNSVLGSVNTNGNGEDDSTSGSVNGNEGTGQTAIIWASPPPTARMTGTTTNPPSKSITLNPTASPTGTPTASPSKSPTAVPTTGPTTGPTLSPTKKSETPGFNCPPGLPCLALPSSGDSKNYVKREYLPISLVWGMMPVQTDPNIWMIRDRAEKSEVKALEDASRNPNYIDPSDPIVQEWMLKLVTLARNDTSLRLHPQPVWIEALKEFVDQQGFGFPLPKDLFIGAVELLKQHNSSFRKLVERELVTNGPGITGKVLFTSLSVLSEAPLTAAEDPFKEWTNFIDSINEMLPENLPPVYAHSTAFVDSLRTTAIVDSTISSYFFANGLYLVIILFFTGNLLLTLMVMAALILILLCFAGLIFFALQIEFGPVESLGVSIFVGLSANYLLHIAHSFHASNINERSVKIQNCIWMVGSPILWSALSTIGGSLFLFACRTWLLTELGILICTIIALSLICSLGFLLALLASIGPLPLSAGDGYFRNLHSWDLLIIVNMMVKCLRKSKRGQENAHSEADERDVE